MSNIWNFWAKRYDSLWVQKVSLRPTRKLIVASILDLLKRHDTLRVLDMGCGTGQLFGDLAASGFSDRIAYCGVDQSKEMITAAQSKHPEAEWQIADVANFDSGSRRFDVVVCAHSFPYYEEKQDRLHKLFELVAPGGDLLLAQACQNSFYDTCVLSVVALTTSKAHYLSRKQITLLAGSRLGAPRVERINPHLLLPSLDLFHWRKES